MKLFSVIGSTIREGDYIEYYVCETKEKAKERFLEEYDSYFYCIDVNEVKEIDGYKVTIGKGKKVKLIK